MPLDKKKYLILIDAIIQSVADIFGDDMQYISRGVAIEHMGFFKIQFKYIPLGYDIIFESDRDIFCIGILDEEGAHNTLHRIKEFNSKTELANVRYALKILQSVLKENDFCFYLTTKEGKVYRKKGQNYKRVRSLSEIV